ncbi:MAG: GntR family transcriptional regulator [Myxococcota bacterium]
MPIGKAVRVHSSEQVFEELARAILDGEFTPGDALPPERVLAEQAGTSRIIVRQAVHRLADLGLVEVRQGGPTRVVDLAHADLRVFDLLYRFTPARYRRDVLEATILSGLCLLDVASRRASDDQREAIHRLVHDARPANDKTMRILEQRFWNLVADAGGNQLYQMEQRWWDRVFGDDPPRAKSEAETPVSLRYVFFKELAKRLRARRDPVAFYRKHTASLLSELE